MARGKPHSAWALIRTLFVATLVLATANFGFAVSKAASQAPARDSANFEAWLTKEVRHQLILLPFYSVFDNLEYRVDGSKVTLLGQVVRPSLKSSAEAAVKRIEGVTAVDNQIKVLPPSSIDDRIRFAAYRAIYSKPSLQMYEVRSVPPIHIIVDNSRITLEGVVATQADKTVAGLAANSIPGVFSVTNNLRVEKD